MQENPTKKLDFLHFYAFVSHFNDVKKEKLNRTRTIIDNTERRDQITQDWSIDKKRNEIPG